jgi:hypothetical protein
LFQNLVASSHQVGVHLTFQPSSLSYNKVRTVSQRFFAVSVFIPRTCAVSSNVNPAKKRNSTSWTCSGPEGTQRLVYVNQEVGIARQLRSCRVQFDFSRRLPSAAFGGFSSSGALYQKAAHRGSGDIQEVRAIVIGHVVLHQPLIRFVHKHGWLDGRSAFSSELLAGTATQVLIEQLHHFVVRTLARLSMFGAHAPQQSRHFTVLRHAKKWSV